MNAEIVEHKQDSIIKEIRSRLTPEENSQCDDAMIQRYMVAVNFDHQHAVRRLRATLQWWRKEKPWEITCRACSQIPYSHYMHCVAHDFVGRPTIYSCMELGSNSNIEDNRRHMISTFESAIQLMIPGCEQKWCWILDFHGFSIKDCDPRLSRIFLNLAAEHYPERLGNFFIIDAPSLFNTLWKAISNFIDPKTKKKIAFLKLKHRQELNDEFSKHYDQETIDWFIKEMEDNRVPGRAGGNKYYDYRAAARLHTDSSSTSSSASDIQDHHINLGSPAFVKHLTCKSCPRQYHIMSSS